jgi:hypothetical protein
MVHGHRWAARFVSTRYNRVFTGGAWPQEQPGLRHTPLT